MSNSTASTQAKPPLDFTSDAIVNQLRHQATNGPAYVQHSATKALAHIKGLYAEAHYEARLAFETARQKLRHADGNVAEQTADAEPSIAQQIEDIRTGRTIVTPEMLGEYGVPVGAASEDKEPDDEDGSSHGEDEPP